MTTQPLQPIVAVPDHPFDHLHGYEILWMATNAARLVRRHKAKYGPAAEKLIRYTPCAPEFRALLLTAWGE